jgi:cell division septum initiation protein DivIVA
LKNEYLKLKDENEKLKKRIDELNKEVFFKNYFSLNDKKMIKGEYLNINNLIL